MTKAMSVPCTIRFSPEAYEELLRIAKAQHSNSVAEAIRQLIDEALAHRAEEMTASQFELVSNRIDYLEKRFSSFHAMTIRAVAMALYYAREHMLMEGSDEERKFFEDDAYNFAENFIQNYKQRQNKKQLALEENGEE